MLSNSLKFKAAHIITRSILRSGDDYRATFGLALAMLNEWTKDLNDAFRIDLDCSPRAWVENMLSIWNEQRIYFNIKGQNRFGGGVVYFDLVNVRVVAEGGQGGSKVATAIDCFMTAARWNGIRRDWN